jgi:hypothetical protein
MNYAFAKNKVPIHSVKKFYNSFITLEELNRRRDKHRFPVYRDCEIGINEYWQAPLIVSVRILI